MKTKLTDEQLNALCKRLIDTMDSMEEGLKDVAPGVKYDSLHSETLELIDDKIFNCDECGYWYDTDELDDNDTCNTCMDCEDLDDEESGE